MAISAVAEGAADNTTGFDTADVDIAADEVAYIAIWGYQTGGTSTTSPATITDWEEVAHEEFAVATTFPIRVTMLYRAGPFSGAQPIFFGSPAQGRAVYQMVKATEQDVADPIVQFKTGEASDDELTITFDAPVTAGNQVLAAFGDWNLRTLTPEAGYSNVYYSEDASIGTCLTMKREDSDDSSPGVTASGADILGGVAVEIRMEAAVITPPRGSLALMGMGT